MSKEKFNLHAAVYLILEKDNLILLMRRFNSGWNDGKYTLPAGHVDGNETMADCMVREAKEETGIIINPNDLNVVHIVHQFSNSEYIDFYLTAKKWSGEPKIMESNKCDDMQWFPLDNLPKDLLVNVKWPLSISKTKKPFRSLNGNKSYSPMLGSQACFCSSNGINSIFRPLN